jgi:AAA+ ATPase superfamily predicted ATPase
MRFQTHRYVTGEQFFGREALLHELRHRQQPLTWLLGNRRSGKTSVLREIDHRNQQGLWPGTVLTVDVQGAGDREGIREAFLEALDEKPQLLNHPIEELERLSMNSFLNDLGKRLSAMPPPVWLLFDEFEELVDIAPQDPQLATQLRRFFHRTRAQVIITASWSFFSLDESQRSTSPLLPDFLPPVL